MEALAASAGTLAVVAGYVLVKRFRRSTCHSNSGCCEFNSPALELARQQTERLDKQHGKLEEIIIMLRKEAGKSPELLDDPALIKEPEPSATTKKAEITGDN